MIHNVIDNRKRRYRWKRIDAVIEATAHDNSVADADEQAPGPNDVVYNSRKGISLAEAIAWGTSEAAPVTLYLYDEGSDID